VSLSLVCASKQGWQLTTMTVPLIVKREFSTGKEEEERALLTAV
jgi:hypothetical protein